MIGPIGAKQNRKSGVVLGVMLGIRTDATRRRPKALVAAVAPVVVKVPVDGLKAHLREPVAVTAAVPAIVAVPPVAVKVPVGDPKARLRGPVAVTDLGLVVRVAEVVAVAVRVATGIAE